MNSTTDIKSPKTQEVEIFPHSLLRIGGTHYRSISNESFSKLVEEIISKDHQIIELRKNISEEILALAKSIQDIKEANKLLNFRRDFYNGKEHVIDDKMLQNTLQKTQFKLFEHLLLEKDKLLSEILSKYELAKNESRANIRSFANESFLRQGLTLSSRSFNRAINHYRDKVKINKSARSTELSLVQYLTRSYTKTTPYSTFTNLALATSKSLEKSLFEFKNSSTIVSNVRLNNYILKNHQLLLTKHKPFYSKLSIRPNPTIESSKDQFRFLVNKNNLESFQTLNRNPVVDLILGFCGESSSRNSFNQLILFLSSQVDAETDQLEAYAKQLIDIGLIEFAWEVSGTDPEWDTSLSSFVRKLKIEDKSTKDLIKGIEKVRKLSKEFGESSYLNREKIIDKAYTVLRENYMKVHQKANLPSDERKTIEELRQELKEQAQENKEQQAENQKQAENGDEKVEKKSDQFRDNEKTYFTLTREQIFYEDTFRPEKIYINEKELNKISDKLNYLLDKISSDFFNDERKRMYFFFLQHYDEDQIPVIRFYEDYYRLYKKEELERKNSKIKKESKKEEQDSKDKKESIKYLNEDHKKYSEEREKVIKEWEEKITKRVSPLFDEDRNEIHFTKAIFDSTVIPKNAESDFLGAFIQPFEDDSESIRAVVNGTFPGYGKMMSRFLHILPSKTLDNLREWNKSMPSEGEIFAENTDASYFNANLHPPLMPHEVWSPGCHNNLPEDKQIQVDNFVVCPNHHKKELYLIDKVTGKKVQVFDLGFQGSGGRSQLFQMLSQLSKSQSKFLNPLINVLNKSINRSNKGFNILPRLVFEDQVIIQRKQWQVNQAHLPKKKSNQSNEDYFIEVNLWRMRLNIPDKVFVRANPHRDLSQFDIEEEKLKKVGRDDYKPQFIDFNDPLLVRLFEKLTRKVPLFMNIEEMLPSPKEMTTMNDEKMVTELVIQWKTNSQ